MIEVFHHNTDDGICTYVALSYKDPNDYLELAVRFLQNEKVEVDGLVGIARLHPEDGNYKKSTGRSVSVDNSKSSTFHITSVSKTTNSRTRIVLIEMSTRTRVDVLVSPRRRTHLRIVP